MTPIHLIVLMCALNHTGFSGSRVVISLYALDLGADQVVIGILMALYAICPMFLAVYAGKLTDRMGPRLPMLIGTLGVGAALMLPALLPRLFMLYVSAFLLGSAFHFFFIAVQGTAGRIGGAENRARNFSLVSLGFSAASFSGPLVAGFAIDYIGHRPAFTVLASMVVIPALLLWLRPGFLPPPTARLEGSENNRVLDLWRIRGLRTTFIASGILSAGWDLFQFYFPVYGHSLGLSASAIGIVLSMFAVATFVIRLLLPVLTRKLSEAQILTASIFVAAGAFVLFPLFQNFYVLAAIAFLLGLGVGCGQPMSMSLIYVLAPPGRASESAGLRATVNNVTHVIVPLVFGSVGAAFGYAPVFFSTALLLAGSGVMMRRAGVGVS